MRTSDQTFLSKLAFNDGDRKTNFHNDICLYLMQQEKLRKIASIFNFEPDKVWANLSAPLLRHGTNYDPRPSVIGYADFTVGIGFKRNDCDECAEILVEVKAYKTHVADIIQQLHTYGTYLTREFFIQAKDGGIKYPRYVLATGYPLTELEKSSLNAAHINTIYVSPDDVALFMKNNQVSSNDLPF